MTRMQLSDFDYDLPPELIVQFPSTARGQSRLLQLQDGRYNDWVFSDLPTLLRAGDLLILNDTRVMKARLYGQKMSGGKIEVLIERIIDDRTALAHIRASKAPKTGIQLLFAGDWVVEVTGRQGELFTLSLQRDDSIWNMLEAIGRLPLPPYITRTPVDDDTVRYQTIYAKTPGAVAAPTAGLHFTPAILHALTEQGVDHAFVTLHVGAGTFQPVRVDDIAAHKMHNEYYYIPPATQQKLYAAKQQGRRIIAVGTTSLRALEASSRYGFLAEPEGDTDIFITPGYSFAVVDTLITNFHLPKSTLLMLVAAFSGYEEIMGAYQYAIANRYHFFSYGDAMILNRRCDK